MVAVSGVVAVAGCQLCYFYAVEHLQVGVAPLIEYTAPVAVVLSRYLPHRHRPGQLPPPGALVPAAALGLRSPAAPPARPRPLAALSASRATVAAAPHPLP